MYTLKLCNIFESNLKGLLFNFNTKINDIMKQRKYTINSTIEVIENLSSFENMLWKPKLSCKTLFTKKANTAAIIDQPKNR